MGVDAMSSWVPLCHRGHCWGCVGVGVVIVASIVVVSVGGGRYVTVVVVVVVVEVMVMMVVTCHVWSTNICM